MLRYLLMLLFLVPSAAHAEWREAESKHFIVYSEGSEEELDKIVLRLERFHRVLRTLSGVKTEELGFKPRIFMMANVFEVERTRGGGRGPLGYYDASPRGSILVGTRRGPSGLPDLNAETVLHHEYTHHFMLDYFPATYPWWFVEGFAEYFGRTRIGDDDKVEIGQVAGSRYASMTEWVPTGQLLTAKNASDLEWNVSSVYGQGWLTVHYLTHNAQRAGQLEAYLAAINAGASYKEAMDKAFGEGARDLDRELRSYRRASTIPTTILPFKPLELPPVKKRALSASENALIFYEIMLSRGLDDHEARDFARDVRARVQRFPSDPYALSMLVEAEVAAENWAAAGAAIESWLKLEPNAARALMHKGRLQVRGLREAGSKDDAAWKAARQLLVKAVNRAPNDPLVLSAYYQSFVDQGTEPPPEAQNAIYIAHETVPNYYPFRYQLARDFEKRGLLQDAVNTIKPMALKMESEEEESARDRKARARLMEKYRAKGRDVSEHPREMLERLEAAIAKQETSAS